jgi:predicted neuraminidase
MMSRRDYNQKLYVAIGGVKRFDDWQTYPLPDAEDGFGVDEPHWWTLPDGTLAAHFRSTTQSFARYGNFRLYRSFSNDGGHSWTPPVRTNFPDAKAKFNALRLSTGQYIMASNPKGGVDPRIPLTLSTSSDGIVFTKVRILLDEPTSARYPNPSKHSGYQYPLVSEVNGFVFIVFSKNQEDIEILRIPLTEI